MNDREDLQKLEVFDITTCIVRIQRRQQDPSVSIFNIRRFPQETANSLEYNPLPTLQVLGKVRAAVPTEPVRGTISGKLSREGKGAAAATG